MPVLALIVLGWFGLLERRFWLVLPGIFPGLPSAIEKKAIEEKVIQKRKFANSSLTTYVQVIEKEHAVQHYL